jgi:hypothetical protein
MVSVKRRKTSWPRLRADKGESWSARMGSTDATTPSTWRWRGGVAARGERGDEAMARVFKRWVRLTGRPSPLLI